MEVKRWDYNLGSKPDEWQIGDQVWVDATLYDVQGFEGDEVTLKRHEPINIRRIPSGS